MNEVTYSLCHKPIIGLVMYLSSLCVFPRPVENVPIALADPSSAAETEFESPVAKPYLLELVFKYPDGQFEKANAIVGRGQSQSCRDKFSSVESVRIPSGFSGTATPLEVTVRVLSSGSVIEHFFVSGACGAAWWTKGEIGRTLAIIDLQKGKYHLVVKSVARNETPKPILTTISLSPGLSK